MVPRNVIPRTLCFYGVNAVKRRARAHTNLWLRRGPLLPIIYAHAAYTGRARACRKPCPARVLFSMSVRRTSSGKREHYIYIFKGNRAYWYGCTANQTIAQIDDDRNIEVSDGSPRRWGFRVFFFRSSFTF